MSSPEVQTEGIKADGDWICSEEECKNVNFARRTHCNRCNKERVQSDSSKKKLGTEIGKAAAEKSRGLFSAEDWQCSKCGNVNWARRQTCNMCNAPKFCDVEERTGYGGGYNDRGIVEYKEREDSDGEYDEYGRRRKPREFKIRVKIESKKIEPKKKSDNNPISELNEDDDDDDDDEEDEGDLSKYALFDSDDDKTTATTSNSKRSRSKSNDKKSHIKSSSRSRSRSKTKYYKNSHRSRTRSRDRKYKRRSRSNSWNRSRRRSRSKSNHKSFSKSPRNYKLRRTNSKSNSRSRSTSKGKYKDNRKY